MITRTYKMAQYGTFKIGDVVKLNFSKYSDGEDAPAGTGVLDTIILITDDEPGYEPMHRFIVHGAPGSDIGTLEADYRHFRHAS